MGSYRLTRGPPTPGPQTATGPRPVRNGAAEQEVSGGQASRASSAALHRSPRLAYRLDRLPTPQPCLHKTGP